MSKHVEVLRRMRNEWPLATDEGPALDAAIASLSAPQSDGEWVLVPRDAIECAIETLENDGDEHGEGRNLRAMLDAAPQPPAEAPPSAPPEVERNGLPALMAALERADRKGYLPEALQEAWDDLDLSCVPAVYGGDAYFNGC